MSWYKRLIIPSAALAAGTGIGVLMGQDPPEALATGLGALAGGELGGMIGGGVGKRYIGRELRKTDPDITPEMYGTFADPHQHALYAEARQLGGVSGMGAGALAANQIYNLGERITYPQSVEVPVERRYLTADQEAYYYPY